MIIWYISQSLSIIGVIIGFISFQMKTDRQVLTLQTVVTILFTAHYILLGAYDAAVLNAVGIIRNFVYFCKDKKFYLPRVFPALFAVIMVVLGFISWENWSSILVILGLAINTVFLSCKNPQNLRKSILVSSPMVLVYNILKFSIGGIIYESVVIISSAIGIFRFAEKRGVNK
jgi:hypothetical protein